MKKATVLLLLASLLPSCVLAWSTPGDGFSGELNLEGTVTSTRNPWVWMVGEGNENLETKHSLRSREGAQRISVPLPVLTVLLGKTTLTTPTGREGLAPRICYGNGSEHFSLVWTEPGVAEVTLPVMGENQLRAGTFVFRMKAVGVLRHVQKGQAVYSSVYDDLGSNGVPGASYTMNAGDVPGALQTMFSGEGPHWLQNLAVTDTTGLSRFSDSGLRQIEGVYGAQTVADSGELRLDGAAPERWQAALPVSIEYQ